MSSEVKHLQQEQKISTNHADCQPMWFLLFGGSSVDGRGQGAYVGRATDVTIARQHYMRVQHDPYSTGYVMIVTDTAMKRVINLGDLPELK